jgi:hypothetical protein
MLRSTRRGLETWQGRNASTPAGAPVLDPTCERLGVQFPGPTRHRWRFTKTHACFSTVSVSRPFAGATVGLFSARSGQFGRLSGDPLWILLTGPPESAFEDAPLTQTPESGFKPAPLHRIAEDFLRKEVEAAGFRLWQSCMARTR